MNIIYIIFLFFTSTPDNTCHINFYYVLEAEKPSNNFLSYQGQESYENIFGFCKLKSGNLRLTLNPSYDEPIIKFDLSEIYIEKKILKIGLLNPRFGGYELSIPSAKYDIFPFIGDFDPGSYFAGSIDNEIWSLFFGGRERGKYYGHIKIEFKINPIHVLPYLIICGEDSETNSKQTYICGFEIWNSVIKTGLNYRLLEYSKKTNSLEVFFKTNIPYKRHLLEYDIYINFYNTEDYKYDFDNEFIYSSGKLLINIDKDLYLVAGSAYRYKSSTKNIYSYELLLGFSFFIENSNISFLGGYEDPEGLLMKCHGKLDHYLYF